MISIDYIPIKMYFMIGLMWFHYKNTLVNTNLDSRGRRKLLNLGFKNCILFLAKFLPLFEDEQCIKKNSGRG